MDAGFDAGPQCPPQSLDGGCGGLDQYCNTDDGCAPSSPQTYCMQDDLCVELYEGLAPDGCGAVGQGCCPAVNGVYNQCLFAGVYATHQPECVQGICQ